MFLFYTVILCIELIFLHNVEGRSSLRAIDPTNIHGDVDYFDLVAQNSPPPELASGRPGSATDTHSCDSIRTVPNELRSASHMYPQGLTYFYRKYTEAYGIPIVSSSQVSDNAIKRACYTVRLLFADKYAIRNSYYKRYGRFALIGVYEGTTSIPEHSWLPSWWNDRARGLGATDAQPVSTGGEENALCYEYPSDRYRREDIVLHEYAHGFHLLGAKYGIAGFESSLGSLYNNAIGSGLWRNTYAATDVREYFAEGVQSYFNAEAYANPTDGIHNDINTREKLRLYDPGLYDLIKSVFPCGNEYILRCDKNRGSESSQDIKINCDGNGGDDDDDDDDDGDDGDGDDDGNDGNDGDCVDKHDNCGYWATSGECQKNPSYMLENCKRSCDVCEDDDNEDGDDDEDDNGGGDKTCQDNNESCASWARRGECTLNPGYMLEHCKLSCDVCDDTTGSCVDNSGNCSFWARSGFCTNPQYKEYMDTNCVKSCNNC